uniref:GDSL esterase/lipase n=1 Tax=Aegilops tauschii TaxID=37682 RepID=M8AMA7_AEGTA
MKLLPAVFLLLLVFLALDDAQARGTPRARWSSMFVFGDDFVDNGNVPNIIGERTSRHGGSGATRRFSNYRMQSDFIARMFGLNEAPPAYELTSDQSCDSSGMTFAFGGAGVFKVAAKKVQTLAAQLDTYMGNVATEILDNVAQLQTLGEGSDRSKDFKRKLTRVARVPMREGTVESVAVHGSTSTTYAKIPTRGSTGTRHIRHMLGGRL